MTSPPPTIDAHAHVFRRGLTLAPGRRYAPDYDAPVELYLDKLDANGLSHGVLVQPSFLGTDNSYLVESLDQARGRLRGVAVVDPAATRDDLRRLDASGIVGIRLNLIGGKLPDLAGADWRRLFDEIGRIGWFVEVQLRAADLAETVLPHLLATGLPVVLDHFALPSPDEGAADAGLQAILTLARSGSIWMKLSAPYRSGIGGEALAERLYPTLRDHFGLERLMWGSDWPHTQFEAAQSYEANRGFLDRLVLSPVERSTLLASPRKLFRF